MRTAACSSVCLSPNSHYQNKAVRSLLPGVVVSVKESSDRPMESLVVEIGESLTPL